MTGPGGTEVQGAPAGRPHRLSRGSVDRRYLGCYIRGAIGLWRSW